MPTNVSSEYKKAQDQYRKAREPAERLRLLRELLATIPKHKGTEHVIRPEGAAQVSLVGPPNCGKSSLHRAVMGSHAAAEPFPFKTQAPLPGILVWEDLPLQLIDLPPVSGEIMEAWLPNALQPAHGHAHEAAADDSDLDDPFGVVLPTLLVTTKADLGFGPDELAVLQELAGTRFPVARGAGVDSEAIHPAASVPS